MSFQQLQRFNFFPHYVEDNRHPSRVVQSTPYIMTYAFVAAMIILIITEITLTYQMKELKTEVESIADTDEDFFLSVICDDTDGCLVDLLKKDSYSEECKKNMPLVLAYEEAAEIRICRITDPGASIVIAIHSGQNIILEEVEELDEGEGEYEPETTLWDNEESTEGGNSKTFTFTPYMEVSLEGEVEKRWLFEEITEVISFSYLLREGFECTDAECFCGNETDGYNCNVLVMKLNDYFIEAKELRPRTLFETLSLIGGFGGLIMTFFRFINRAVYMFTTKQTLVKVETI